MADDNPTLILTTLDRHLDHPVSLVLYGRAALWLAYGSAVSRELGTTEDVDCIIPLSQVQSLTDDIQFWDAMAALREEIAPRGLYMSHLFPEDDIFLRRQWRDHLVELPRPALRNLRLFRPAGIDLVLTKMMRGADDQDMADARLIIERERITKAQLNEAFTQMRPIQIVELQDAFNRAKPLVVGMAF